MLPQKKFSTWEKNFPNIFKENRSGIEAIYKIVVDREPEYQTAHNLLMKFYMQNNPELIDPYYETLKKGGHHLR